MSIHAALQAVLLLQLRGGHPVHMMPPHELLAGEDVDASATVFPAAAKAIPTEPLLTYNPFLLIQSMAMLFFIRNTKCESNLLDL